MNRLLDIGFEQVGHWLLDNGKLVFELNRSATERNILYAFVRDTEIKYVGKSTRTLFERLAGYKNPGPTQSTNIKNNQLIKAELAEGSTIDIYVLPDRGLVHYGVFHLNLAAGLEDDIIRVFDPEWNGAQKSIAVSTSNTLKSVVPDLHMELDSGDTPIPSVPVVHRFKFILQPTYYKLGFFNVSVVSSRYLGTDGEKIELFLGSDRIPSLGSINRRANLNGTPRIMGGTALRDWFQTNAKQMQSIGVEVMSPTSIRLFSNGD